MTPHGESQDSSEVTRTILLTTRATINIGKWNVRIMWEIGMTNQMARKMKRYKLVVLGISETS